MRSTSCRVRILSSRVSSYISQSAGSRFVTEQACGYCGSMVQWVQKVLVNFFARRANILCATTSSVIGVKFMSATDKISSVRKIWDIVDQWQLNISKKFKMLKIRTFCHLSCYFLKFQLLMSTYWTKLTIIKKEVNFFFSDNWAIEVLTYAKGR